MLKFRSKSYIMSPMNTKCIVYKKSVSVVLSILLLMILYHHLYFLSIYIRPLSYIFCINLYLHSFMCRTFVSCSLKTRVYKLHSAHEEVLYWSKLLVASKLSAHILHSNILFWGASIILNIFLVQWALKKKIYSLILDSTKKKYIWLPTYLKNIFMGRCRVL